MNKYRPALIAVALGATLGVASPGGFAVAGSVGDLSRSEPVNWQTWNRGFNQSRPLANRVLAWADEGKAGYDCKGFVLLKAMDLMRQGVALSRMRALSIDEGAGNPKHMVLEVDEDKVFDDTSPWVQRASDYKVFATYSIGQVMLSAAMSGFTEFASQASATRIDAATLPG